ncbi:MAG: MBL fold metallo-hydrolase [Deltaproteobacteria bacterium]|nr:MBL fold metallo-hydrolase [Deltaproteobacteria bacterium]
MKGEQRIAEGIYLIGGPDISHADDAAVFLIDFGNELVMIDSGAGKTPERLVHAIENLYLRPEDISTLILTHCHIDHIGAAPYFRERFQCSLIAHELDAAAIETGDPVQTAATWYGTDFPPTLIDRKLDGEHEVLNFGDDELHCLHTPGHTPGSISLFIDRGGKRILFGQDIHGPFLPAFRSDLNEWKRSMKKLIDLKADILCEGHFGIFRSPSSVRAYIENYLSQY